MKNKYKKNKLISAFTMIELILVIVILGIVGSLGSEILSVLYNNYYWTAKTQRLEAQANLAADIIAARLKHRIPQTTAALDKNNKYKSVNGAKDSDLIFYLKAYELERRDFTAWKDNSAYPEPRVSGYINNLKDTSNKVNNKYTDTITITSDDSRFNGLGQYTIFFNDDSAIFYKPKNAANNKAEDLYLKAYYEKNQPFYYGCRDGSITYPTHKPGTIEINRSDCDLDNGDNVRPSRAGSLYRYSFSKEVNKIVFKSTKDLGGTKIGTLSLEVLDATNNKMIAGQTYTLARNVSAFSFTSLSADPHFASGIVFKICVYDNEKNDLSGVEHEVCQTRIVQ